MSTISVSPNQLEAYHSWNEAFLRLGFKLEGASIPDPFGCPEIRFAVSPITLEATPERIRAFQEYLQSNSINLPQTFATVVLPMKVRKPSWATNELPIPAIGVTFIVEDFDEQIRRWTVLDKGWVENFLEHEVFWLLSV